MGGGGGGAAGSLHKSCSCCCKHPPPHPPHSSTCEDEEQKILFSHFIRNKWSSDVRREELNSLNPHDFRSLNIDINSECEGTLLFYCRSSPTCLCLKTFTQRSEDEEEEPYTMKTKTSSETRGGSRSSGDEGRRRVDEL